MPVKTGCNSGFYVYNPGNIPYIMRNTYRIPEIIYEVCAKLMLHIFAFSCNIYAR